MRSSSKKETKSGCLQAVQPLRLMSYCAEWFLAHEHPEVLQCCSFRMQLYSLSMIGRFLCYFDRIAKINTSSADLTRHACCPGCLAAHR